MVVDDVLDVGLGAELGDGGGFVGGVGGFKDGDAEGLMDLDDVGAGEARAGFRVAGNGAVPVGDEVAMRDGRADGAGELAPSGGGGEGKGGQGGGHSLCGAATAGMAWGANDVPRMRAV